MRFASLGSGSRGNATLVEAGRTRVLVDCGFSVTEVERRMARLGRGPAELDAILVTHEHSDHIAGVTRLARRYRVPVWSTAGTAAALGIDGIGDVPVHRFSGHESFAIGDLQVDPFPVPHDAREPSQFVFGDGNVRIGVLTDIGAPTDHVRRCLDGCQALLLECNHDPVMLAEGAYPPALKARVGGRLGHLSNAQAGDLLGSLDTARLQHVAAAHLSDANNTPELARGALAAALGCDPAWVAVAGQAGGLGWRDVS